jgi:hypothetical protein
MNYRDIDNLFTSLLEKEIKGRIYFVVSILLVALLVAIGQSDQFVSSLWVITEFGFNYWSKHIHTMFDDFYWWAIISGVFGGIGAFVGSTSTELKKIAISTFIGFGIGFAFTYLLIFSVSIIIYVPLGIFSFVFPDQIHFLSFGFAFLCSTYIVFTIIALDTPPLLLEIIKTAQLYFKLLAVLFGSLLVIQIMQMTLSILQILMEYSIWKVHLPAFILAFGVSLLLTVIISLRILRNETKYKKVAIIAGGYILSIATGNLSGNGFYLGEYPSALITTFFAAIVYPYVLNKVQKSIVSVTSIAAGGICGLGLGLFVANYTGLSIIGQGWFGIMCGVSITLGLGISFGLMIAPRIGELMTKLFRFRPLVGFLISIGFAIGTMSGFIVGGFINR